MIRAVATTRGDEAGVRRRLRGERGEVTVTVLMVPLVLMVVLAVVQFGLAYYARQVLAGAVQDGAAAGARQDSSPGAGAALAEQLIVEGAGSLLSSHSTSGGSDGERVVVSASGQVVSVFPFWSGPTVSASGSATIEEFAPQTEVAAP